MKKAVKCPGAAGGKVRPGGDICCLFARHAFSAVAAATMPATAALCLSDADKINTTEVSGPIVGRRPDQNVPLRLERASVSFQAPLIALF